MQPRLTFLTDADTDRIIDGAMTVLAETGLHVPNAKVLDATAAHDGAAVDGERVRMSRDLVERCLKTVPSEFAVWPQDSDDPIVLAGDAVHFMAGLVGTYVYDERADGLREATTADLVNHTKVVDVCDHIDFQSGAFVVNDIPKPLFSTYRYYLSFLYCGKPPVIGAIRGDDLPIIHEMLQVMAGGETAAEERPASIIHVNPSSPLALTDIVAENVFYAARHMLPVMLTPIPLAGGSSPVTLAGTLVQHTAENLGSIVVGQCARPGAPVMFGGGPSVMDMRKGTAAMASPESVMMGVSLGQIARRLGVPSASGAGRADSKRVDYQGGMESGVALTTMALAGINLIRGPGTLEYANVISTEKLLIDNEICGIAKHLVRSIQTSDEALALDVIAAVGTSTRGYLAAPHTMKWFREEAFMPSAVLDRGGRREFEENESRDSFQRARIRMDEILDDYTPRPFDAAKKKELDRIILAHAREHGADSLPVLDIA